MSCVLLGPLLPQWGWGYWKTTKNHFNHEKTPLPMTCDWFGIQKFLSSFHTWPRPFLEYQTLLKMVSTSYKEEWKEWGIHDIIMLSVVDMHWSQDVCNQNLRVLVDNYQWVCFVNNHGWPNFAWCGGYLESTNSWWGPGVALWNLFLHHYHIPWHPIFQRWL